MRHASLLRRACRLGYMVHDLLAEPITALRNGE